MCLLWTPDLHLLLSHGPHSWRKGSLHLRPCLEVLAAPEFQTHFKVGSVVLKPRATKSGLTANFGTVIRVKGTMWLYLHGQLSDLESCVALCRQCLSYVMMLVSLLKQEQEQILSGKHFIVLGDITINLTLIRPCSTQSMEGVK